MREYFTQTHEWMKVEEDGTVTIGITHYAQDELGDVVFVDFPVTDGRRIKAGDTIAIIESVKAASDIISPISGTILAVNAELKENPSLINQSPEEKGWFFSIQLDMPSEIESLMGKSEYQELIKNLS